MDLEQRLKDLQDSNERVREMAREDLAYEMDDEVALAILEICSGTGSEEVRADALIGLGPVIEEAGLDYGDDSAADLGEFGPPISVQTYKTLRDRVRQIYSDESQPKIVRRRAFEVLVRDPQRWQQDEIRKHFASSDDEWKRTAVFGMGMMTGFEKEIADVVRTGTGHELFEAVRAAGRMNVEATADRIRALATSSKTDPELRIVAILALAGVDPDSEELLERLSGDADPDVADAAEAALEELLDDEEMTEEDWDAQDGEEVDDDEDEYEDEEEEEGDDDEDDDQDEDDEEDEDDDPKGN